MDVMEKCEDPNNYDIFGFNVTYPNTNPYFPPGINFYIDLYRVAGLSCPEAGGCKSAILRGFPDIFCLFGPFHLGILGLQE